MKGTLVLPVAGKSSRFPGMRPKWLLTMPSGKLMIEEAIAGLDFNQFDRILIIALQDHIAEHFSQRGFQEFREGLTRATGLEVSVVQLMESTSSQVETLVKGLEVAQVQGPIFVKDCDNHFAFKWEGGNEVAVVDLHEVGLMDAKNKSYVQTDSLGEIINIVEKQVISDTFCCGGYGFADAQAFRESAQYLLESSEQEVYTSLVIFQMIMSGTRFRKRVAPGASYVDWGTAREYHDYMRSFMTLFCDVDGMLLENGSKFRTWKTPAITKNLERIAHLQKANRLFLVVTTSRPEHEREYVEQVLRENGVSAQRWLMGLPHTQRVLANDFSPTNPYPSALSINLERDSELLSGVLQSLSRS